MSIWEKISQYGFEILIFIILAVVGITLELVITSKTIKTWKKTAVFMAVAEAIPVVLGWLSWNSGSVALCCVSAALAVLFLLGGIYGHRKKWKQAGE